MLGMMPGFAPTCRLKVVPFLNTIKVGIDRIWNCWAIRGLSSTFTLTTFARPAYFCAICSTTGAIERHGPHHGAQKSTSTGTLLLTTSRSKVASVTTSGLVLVPLAEAFEAGAACLGAAPLPSR